jgi:hypothetical protein
MSSSSLESLAIASPPNIDNGFVPMDKDLLECLNPSFFEDSGRLKRHFGTLANATPHLRTWVQVTRTPTPPPHSKDFNMTACGEDARINKLIRAVDSN